MLEQVAEEAKGIEFSTTAQEEPDLEEDVGAVQAVSPQQQASVVRP